MSKVQAIPQGYHTLTPSLIVRGASEAIEFYKRAFGAEQRGVLRAPDGKVMHAELQIGDSIVMLSDEFPQDKCASPAALQGTTGALLIYTEDVDALWARATAAGCKPLMPLSDMFWGDRYGKLLDPFGHAWEMATHKEELTPEQMHERFEAMLKRFPGQSAE